MGSGPEIEEELLAVPKFDQPAGRRLLGPGARLARAQGDDPHFIRVQAFSAGIIHIKFRNGRGRRAFVRRCQGMRILQECDAFPGLALVMTDRI